MKKQRLCICGALFLSLLAAASPMRVQAAVVVAGGPSQSVSERGGEGVSFDVNQFSLPANASVLAVAEGKEGANCRVLVYEKTPAGWQNCVDVDGHMGKAGMSNHRTEGDKTTPIGVFQMNTPFGQASAQLGFPRDYQKIDDTYVWSDVTNRLSRDLTQEGERVGSDYYAGYYDYVLDAGYNRNAIEKKGSALFFHCEGADRTGTSGCVAMPKEAMAELMRLYAKNPDGCYAAMAPTGTFSQIYQTYGVNQGLSPDGDF